MDTYQRDLGHDQQALMTRLPAAGMQLQMSRPMPQHMANLLHAMSGPDHRAPLVYSGDVANSLERLRSDLRSHHSDLCGALGEPQQPDYPSFPALQPLLEHTPGMPSNYLDYHSPQGASSSYMPSPGLGQLGRMISGSTPQAPGPASAYLMSSPIQGLQYRSGLAPTVWPNGAAPSLLGWHPAAAGQLPSRYQPPNAMQTYPGSRMSEFSINQKSQQEPGSLFAAESSTFMWPPVGATFEGHRSRLIPDRAQPIDSLSDLGYRKKKMSTFEELCSEPPLGVAVRRHELSSQDTLDTFLSDFAKGGAKPLPAALPSYESSFNANTSDQNLHASLMSFAAGRGMASAR